MAQVYHYEYRGDPQEFMVRVSRFPNLSKDEEIDYVLRWQRQEDRRALDILFASHQKFLVKKIFKAGLRSRFGEALQTANIGLLIAINKFETERGFRLSTYANGWIGAQLKEMYAPSMVNMVTTADRKKVSAHLGKVLKRITDGREPTQQDFEKAAEFLQVSIKDVLDFYPVMTQGDMSLDAPLVAGESDSASRLDFMPDNSLTPEEIYEQIDEVEKARQRLAEAMEILEGREREIFIARRIEDPPETLETLADKFNISRERIRQIEVKAFDRIFNKIHGVVKPERKRGPKAKTPETLDM